MIVYFSATGNSKYVAERIAAAQNDRIVSVADCIRNKDLSLTLGEGETLGIIAPTYFWGLPSIVDDFLRRLKLHVPSVPYIYFVTTYGTTTGQTAYFVRKHLEEKSLMLSASFSVRMPDTWTPIFDLSDSQKMARINNAAEAEIDAVINRITNGVQGNFMKAPVPMFGVKLFHATYETARQTKYFTVEDTCIGCSLCARKCPVDAIEMQSGRPVWVRERCAMCLGCLHRCPKFSIQYRNKTKKHGQYSNPHVEI